jgi:lysophospholipase L1-like esterase
VSRSRRFSTLVLVAGTSVLALLAAEILLRSTTPATFGQASNTRQLAWLVDDPVLAFANRPGFENAVVRINRHGFRGAELSSDDRKLRRIVFLGDSSTFGIWLDAAEDDPRGKRLRFTGYPVEFAQLLEQEGRRDLEVVNAGVVGYTSSHALRLFVTKVLPLEPDIVVLRFGVNEHKLSKPDSGRRVVEPESPWRREALYRFANWRLMRLVLRAYRMAPWLRRGGDPTYFVAPDRFEADLRRFVELAREHRFQLLLLDYPLRPLAWGEHPHHAKVYRPSGQTSLAEFHQVHARYQAVVRSVAAREGIPLLATGEEFGARVEPLFGDLDFVHPNAHGARVLAKLLREQLGLLGWIPEPAESDGPGALGPPAATP